MGAYPVRPEKEAELLARMKELGIHEHELDEVFLRGSGSGGQKRNKTSSAVQLTHRPTGTMVRASRERSQALNRFFARRELCDRLSGGGVDTGEAERIRRNKARTARRHRAKKSE
jgi:protein subunit release factor B